MKAVSIDLGPGVNRIELIPIADAHIGDRYADMALLIRRIEYIRKTPNAYALLNGDLINNAVRNSVSDIYAEQVPPMRQLEKAVELFSGIKDRIIGVTGTGNHEFRTFRDDGIDITKLICQQLGIVDRYSDGALVLFLRFGQSRSGLRETNGSGQIREQCYTVFANHGSGGGRKEGAKAIRLADMASIIDADVYVHSHTHMPLVMKQSFFRIDPRNSTFRAVDKLFVNTAAFTGYGGYAEAQEHKPMSKQTPHIFLSGEERSMTATL